MDKLEKYLKKNYHGANYHVAYEAGFCGFWIQRSVNQIGIRCDVIHTTDVPTNAKESKRKTDKVDSLKKAKGLKNGELNAIYVPN